MDAQLKYELSQNLPGYAAELASLTLQKTKLTKKQKDRLKEIVGQLQGYATRLAG